MKAFDFGGEISIVFFDFSSSVVLPLCVSRFERWLESREMKRSRRKPKLTKELSHPAKCVVLLSLFCVVLLCFGVWPSWRFSLLDFFSVCGWMAVCKI